MTNITPKKDEWKPLLDEVYKTCQAQVHEEPENERFIGWEALYGVLIYEAIKLFLPEIKGHFSFPIVAMLPFSAGRDFQTVCNDLSESANIKGERAFEIVE